VYKVYGMVSLCDHPDPLVGHAIAITIVQTVPPSSFRFTLSFHHTGFLDPDRAYEAANTCLISSIRR
jgi:hypothetical protein